MDTTQIPDSLVQMLFLIPILFTASLIGLFASRVSPMASTRPQHVQHIRVGAEDPEVRQATGTAEHHRLLRRLGRVEREPMDGRGDRGSTPT